MTTPIRTGSPTNADRDERRGHEASPSPDVPSEKRHRNYLILLEGASHDEHIANLRLELLLHVPIPFPVQEGPVPLPLCATGDVQRCSDWEDFSDSVSHADAKARIKLKHDEDGDLIVKIRLGLQFEYIFKALKLPSSKGKVDATASLKRDEEDRILGLEYFNAKIEYIADSNCECMQVEGEFAEFPVRNNNIRVAVPKLPFSKGIQVIR